MGFYNFACLDYMARWVGKIKKNVRAGNGKNPVFAKEVLRAYTTNYRR
ncbi:MAG: hypothetical protein KF775_15215 [Cyclobacteriaceae bacterium]|nr:hypothetical protein [Cyclobacteriaceae bacterium]